MTTLIERIERAGSKTSLRADRGVACERRGRRSWLRATSAAVAFALALFAASPGLSLDTPASFDRFQGEDAKTIEEIAAYPAAARQAALVAAGHPEELLAIQRIQQRSADDFAALLADVPRETQEQVWNLVRHPELAQELAAGGRKSAAELEAIASRYPEPDRAAIVEEGRERHALWTSIYALDLEVEQKVFVELADQPAPVREAFDELTRHPGLTSLLIDDIQTTTVLGALYRENPTGVEANLNTIHEQVAARRAADERAWAEEVADTETAAELEHAARLFAEEDDLDWEEVRSEPATNVQITYQINVRPYPYWFGYPYWYRTAYWYPQPIWSHVGFYYGFGSGYVSYGLPSPYFLGWYHTTYVPRYQVAYRKTYPGYKPYHRGRYYDQHRPYSTAGKRRHHDLATQRAHYDSQRHRSRSLDQPSPTVRSHRRGREHGASRAPTAAPSRRHGPAARRAAFERSPSRDTTSNARRGSRPADATRTADRRRASSPPAVSARPPSRSPSPDVRSREPDRNERRNRTATTERTPDTTPHTTASRRNGSERVRRDDSIERTRRTAREHRGPTVRTERRTVHTPSQSPRVEQRPPRSADVSMNRPNMNRSNARINDRSGERRQVRRERTRESRESRSRVDRQAMRQAGGPTAGPARGPARGMGNGRPAARGGDASPRARGQGRNQRGR